MEPETGALERVVIYREGRMENQTEQKEPTPEEHEEAMMLYAQYLEDIRYCKKQQWYVAYLYFLLQGAILYTYEKMCSMSNALMIVSVIVAMLATYLIRKYEHDMARYRDKKKKLREDFFSEKINRVLWPVETQKRRSVCQFCFDDISFLCVAYIFFMIVGLFVIVILNGGCN
ncbi:MAG TPA: hypothetical protein P5077_01175 [bacterium]|nr:hypothetical protein [bacterium]